MKKTFAELIRERIATQRVVVANAQAQLTEAQARLRAFEDALEMAEPLAVPPLEAEATQEGEP